MQVRLCGLVCSRGAAYAVQYVCMHWPVYRADTYTRLVPRDSSACYEHVNDFVALL